MKVLALIALALMPSVVAADDLKEKIVDASFMFGQLCADDLRSQSDSPSNCAVATVLIKLVASDKNYDKLIAKSMRKRPVSQQAEIAEDLKFLALQLGVM